MKEEMEVGVGIGECMRVSGLCWRPLRPFALAMLAMVGVCLVCPPTVMAQSSRDRPFDLRGDRVRSILAVRPGASIPREVGPTVMERALAGVLGMLDTPSQVNNLRGAQGRSVWEDADETVHPFATLHLEGGRSERLAELLRGDSGAWYARTAERAPKVSTLR